MNQEPQDPRAPLDRRDGVRRVRHASNWTAAALIAATAVTTGYLARPAAARRSRNGIHGRAGQHGGHAGVGYP